MQATERDMLDRVADAHEREGRRRQAEFYNFGWSAGGDEHHDDICSKTSHGYLTTRRHRTTGKVEHYWKEY
jgi:hypothetical protein